MVNLEEYIGDFSQLIGIKQYVLNSGRGKGVECIDVDNGSGLYITINLDRGFDISSLKYKGVNISYTSKNGIQPSKNNYLDNVGLGFLMTCGLDNIGPESQIGNKQYIGHGRLNTIKAENIKIDKGIFKGIPYVSIYGEVHQTSFFGETLVLCRTIKLEYNNPVIYIKNRIKNLGFDDSYMAVMYHFNIGYPMLSPETIVKLNSSEKIPKNEQSHSAIANYRLCEKPSSKFKPQVLYHELEEFDGMCNIRVYNPNILGMGLELSIDFPYNELSKVTQWRMFSKGEYVLGIEPCNVFPLGREKLILNKTMPIIKAGESVSHDFVITIREN